MRDLFRERRDAHLVAVGHLRLAEQDWPRFRAVLADFAVRGGWSMSDCAQPRALGGGLGRAGVDGGGAHVAYRQWAWADPPEPAATLFVVAPPGSADGRPVAAALFRRLAHEWPGALTVSGAAR